MVWKHTCKNVIIAIINLKESRGSVNSKIINDISLVYEMNICVKKSTNLTAIAIHFSASSLFAFTRAMSSCGS